uniref:Uncharacterized protein n=1 Tax=Syphacia muris TaxID=451379 RepID=A0A0N5ALN9_9BILA
MRRAASSQVRSSRRHYKCLQHQSTAPQTSKVPQFVANLRTDFFKSSIGRDLLRSSSATASATATATDTEQKSKRRQSKLSTKRRIEKTAVTDIAEKKSSTTKLSADNWNTAGYYYSLNDNTYFRPFTILSLARNNNFDDTDTFSKFFELSKIRPRIDEALINGSICHTMNAEKRQTTTMPTYSDATDGSNTATTSEQNMQQAKFDAENFEANKENECAMPMNKLELVKLKQQKVFSRITPEQTTEPFSLMDNS